MKRKLHDIWKIKEGSKTFWKVQAEKGVLTFRRKRDAEKWVDSFKKGNDFKYNMAQKGC